MKYSREQIDSYRDINVDGAYWHEDIFATFEQGLKEKGISVAQIQGRPAIYFSGFWSQGDGACFEGFIDDLETFMTANNVDNDAVKHMAAAGGSISFSCEQTGRYCHKSSVTFLYDHETPEDLYDANDFRLPVLQAVCPESQLEYFEEQAKEVFQDHMRDMYEQLKEEYEYLTSDAAIIETLEANDIGPEEEEEEEEEETEVRRC